ncbi:MAG: hypothetical protein KDD67_10570 [Ignavibacteriae bacterium]|nr:hypothetical protein [Ignavibacteriota bacterium]MCB9217798.1 hypothetical protein [Ignavibacteria bacterium]
MKALKIFSFTLMLSLGLMVTACGDDTDPEADFDEHAQDGPVELRIVKGAPGSELDVMKFDITAPEADAVVTGDSVNVVLTLQGMSLKAPTPGEGANDLAYSKDGQHIHVIVDNEPYMAMYDTTFRIGGLAPGAHTIRAFPSRSWHESVKKPGAFIARTFYVGEKSGDALFNPEQPLLTYSRPKGEYVGTDARKIMIDFYLSNCELGPNAYKVIAWIDGKEMDTLTEWVPYFIEGLKEGEHSIRLQLIGSDGVPVANGSYNDTERKITVKKEKKESAKKEGEEEDLEKDLIDVGRHSSGM